MPPVLALCGDEGVDKFYLSHLVYAGRGNKHRGEDTVARPYPQGDGAADRPCLEGRDGDQPLEIVTGNNDADAVSFLAGSSRTSVRTRPPMSAPISEAWGGNSSGLGVANIDPQGKVHPDTYWSGYRSAT